MRMNTINYRYFVFRPLTREFYNKNYNEVYETLDLEKYQLIEIGEGTFETTTNESVLFFVNEKDRLLNQIYNDSSVQTHWFTGMLILVMSKSFDECALYFDNTPTGIFKTGRSRHFELVRVLNNSESDKNDEYSKLVTEYICRQIENFSDEDEIEVINYFEDIAPIPEVGEITICA